MTRVRIVCSTVPPLPRDARLPIINGILPSIVDTRVELVLEDGTVTEVPGVTRVRWTVDSSPEPARAYLEVDGVEVDVEGITAGREPQGCPGCAGLKRRWLDGAATDSADAPPCPTCGGTGWAFIVPAPAGGR